MKKIVLKIIALILICCALILPLNFLFTTYDGRYTYKMLNEMYQSEDNIDAVFLGSSHTYKSLDPDLADEIIGINTFNAGSSVQGMNTSYYLLREIMEYHKLKTVYLDTNPAVARVKANDINIFYISDYMKFDSKNKLELLKSGGNESILNGYITFRRNFTNLNIIANLKSRKTPLSDYSSVTYENEEYRGDGFVYSNGCNPITEKNIKNQKRYDFSDKVPVGENYREYMEKIIELCKKNDIKLVLLEHPMLRKNTDSLVGYANYVSYMYGIAEKYGIEYWNFNLYKGDIGITDSDYLDITHLNGEGAEKYTKAFSQVAKMYNDGEDVSSLFANEYIPMQ